MQDNPEENIWHDPACPFDKFCYCGEDGQPAPHDMVITMPTVKADRVIAAQRIEILDLRNEIETLRAALLASEAMMKEIFLHGHSEGWTGNQMRRDVQHVDAEKGWSLYVSNGALQKTKERAALGEPPIA